MHSLISKSAVLLADPWVGLEARSGPGDLLVPAAQWSQLKSELLAREGRLGVLLEPSDDPALIAADLDHLALVAVRFPALTDGRGFSIARLLRSRYGWRGELRACGPLTRDGLFYLARCGFDSFELRAGEDPQAALAEFARFDEVYQAAQDRGPLFERRVTAGAAPA